MAKDYVILRSARFYAVVVGICNSFAKPDQMEIYETVRIELFDGRLATLREGFVTDCHSTPKAANSLFPSYDNRTNLGAMLHDLLYEEWERFIAEQPVTIENLPFLTQMRLPGEARLYADQAYLELMERFAPGQWRNRVYYWVVRALGWYNWRKFRAANK